MPNGHIDNNDRAELRRMLLPLFAASTVINHTPQDIDGGPTCDERGCAFCNGGLECVPQMVDEMLGKGDNDPEMPHVWQYRGMPTDVEIFDAIELLVETLKANAFGQVFTPTLGGDCRLVFEGHDDGIDWYRCIVHSTNEHDELVMGTDFYCEKA